ncbi:MAG TPA: hypothetical protein VJW76_15435, partial [Verrucomicrobiae bacterium]|nr:hypothetical protein [Verrucomicrobiae bacterium]
RWDHEPGRYAVSERGCVEDQPQHWASSGLLRLIEDDTAALRFMERCGVRASIPFHRNCAA